MNNKCVNLRYRKRKGVIYAFCIRKKAEIEQKECFGCLYREYRNVPKKCLKTRIKPISKKRICVSKKTYNEVYKRDGGVCRLCGRNDIQLHHIIYRSESKALIDEPSNCIMLCLSCHRLVHSNKKKYQPELKKLVQ